MADRKDCRTGAETWQDGGQAEMKLLLLLPFLFSSCYYASDGNGAKFLAFGTDLGVATIHSENRSGGGPSTLITGASSGERLTDRIETRSSGEITIGGIHIKGVVDDSTGIGERGFVMLGIARVVAMAKSVQSMFDFASNRDNVDAATDQLKSNNSAAVDTARIKTQPKLISE